MTDFIKLAGLDNVPAQLKGAQVAIGNFDGFHRGHQHVFAALKERARQRGVPAVVLTFEPHPRDVFAPEPFMFRLTEGNAKARLAEALGLDGIVIMPFTRDLSQVEAEDFVSRYLVDALAVSGVIVGADFHFGRGRRGTPDFLRSAGAQYGFEVEPLALIDDGSNDGTGKIIDRLAQKDKNVRSVHHKANLGFTGAMRTSFASAKNNLVFL
ncbi:MAG: glycosyltransferase, partial [Devosia nanyangense]|nr:glycosyltransferase [Devosia nanyangense]